MEKIKVHLQVTQEVMFDQDVEMTVEDYEQLCEMPTDFVREGSPDMELLDKYLDQRLFDNHMGRYENIYVEKSSEK